MAIDVYILKLVTTASTPYVRTHARGSTAGAVCFVYGVIKNMPKK